MTGATNPVEFFQRFYNLFMRTPAAFERALRIIQLFRSIDAHGDLEIFFGEKLDIVFGEKRCVRSDRETDGSAAGLCALACIGNDVTHQSPMQERLASHESEKEVGAGRGLRNQAIGCRVRDLGRHHPWLTTERTSVSVAVGASHVT